MKATTKDTKYDQAIGRRKTASARVRITKSDKGGFTVNGKDYKVHFPTEELQAIATASLNHKAVPKKFAVTVVVRGGGIHGQAVAVQHGIARALIENDSTLRTPLKQAKMLTRDSRMKERRKFGLKKARKAPQWSKR